MSENNNDITNKLIMKYDEKFDEFYSKIVDIKSSISNKEELIIKINNEITYKDNSITVLQYTMVLVILIGVLFILYGMKNLTIGYFIIISTLLFVIYLFFIYYNIYSVSKFAKADQYIKNLNVEMKTFLYDAINEMNGYKCPVDCEDVHDEAPATDYIQGYNQPTLNIDPQTNVWKYGDIPMDGWTNIDRPGSDFYTNQDGIKNYSVTDDENENNSPKAAFSTTYPKSTYYKCEWLGGNSNTKSGGLPNKESIQYSTIPCSYRPNYQEAGRYICLSDPNKNGIGNSNCDEIIV
jgi:hypothetical protein